MLKAPAEDAPAELLDEEKREAVSILSLGCCYKSQVSPATHGGQIQVGSQGTPVPKYIGT